MFAGARKYQSRPCECSRVHESASRGHKGANKGCESAHSDCRGAQRGCESIQHSHSLNNTHSREKVLVNFLLQAKRVLVYCRGLESALEAVRVSVKAVRVSIEAKKVPVEVVREPVGKTVLKISGTHQNILVLFQSF